jgi:hypothetical protein
VKGGEEVRDKVTPGSMRHWRSKIDHGLLNGKPRATLIQRFDGSAVLLGPKAHKLEFDIGATLHEIQTKAEELGWVVAVEHLHKEREA